ncbi:MAG: helix-turn-helix domain-containing protein [Catenulispora sp.]
MVTRVDVRGALIAWARARSGMPGEALARRFPKLEQWEGGDIKPTLKQLESFADATHTPIGFFFLREPPEERLPLPDFRTLSDRRIRHPSPDLLDTIYGCQQRQDWYRDYAQENNEMRVAIVGGLNIGVDPAVAAVQVQEVLEFPPSQRGHSWSEAFRPESASSAGTRARR